MHYELADIFGVEPGDSRLPLLHALLRALAERDDAEDLLAEIRTTGRFEIVSRPSAIPGGVDVILLAGDTPADLGTFPASGEWAWA